MKNTTSEQEDSIFRKKGFFIALYSCLGAVAILALVITITNFGQPGFQAEDYDEEAAYVGADQVEPYLAQADEEAWFRPRQTPPPPTPPPPRPTPPPDRPSGPPESEQAIPIPAEPTPPPPTVEVETEAPPQVQLPTTFAPFDEDTRLLWPVYGPVAMQFSMDSLIYDPTLDQFRTNDDLRISAESGTNVQASAEGRVLSIGRNVVRGNYVKIDHGNGWIATYGQLADSKLVGEGEIVQAGQSIGTVGSPSLFGSMLGYHVNLRVTRDDVPVNPYALLAAR